MEAVEAVFGEAVAWLKLILEIIAASFVALGGGSSLVRLARAAAAGRMTSTPIRLHFARFLSLALEFQLAADIVGTTLAPSWEQIGKLGAIAITRTGLNYFLGREMREQRETLAGEQMIAHTGEKGSAPSEATTVD